MFQALDTHLQSLIIDSLNNINILPLRATSKNLQHNTNYRFIQIQHHKIQKLQQHSDKTNTLYTDLLDDKNFFEERSFHLDLIMSQLNYMFNTIETELVSKAFHIRQQIYQPTIPNGWEERFDTTLNRLFYFQPSTGKHMYNPPPYE